MQELVPWDTIVVGGGPAGLAAAGALADVGHRTLVLEKRPVFGGKVSSWRDRDGDVLETGLHALFGGYDQLHALLRRIGIAHHLLWQPHALTFALPPGFSGRIGSEPVFEAFRFTDAPAPFNGIAAVLGARALFSPWEKVLFASGTLPILARDHAYAARQDDLSYADWHRRRGMSEHMLRAFFAPMALALNFTPVERISAEAMLRVMAYFASSRDASRPAFLDGPPNERLIEPWLAHLRGRGVACEREARVAALAFEGGRCSGVLLADGRRFAAHNVVLATPVHDAARLLPAELLRQPALAGIARLESSPVINGHFWFDRPVTAHTNLVFGAGTLLPVHADLGQSSPGYGWSGRSFFEVCIAPADELIALDDEAVVARVMADFRRLYPAVRGAQLVKAKLVRVPRSVYRARPGAERLRPGARTPIANLFLAGCYTNHGFPASIEGAVRSARAAVDALAGRAHVAA